MLINNYIMNNYINFGLFFIKNKIINIYFNIIFIKNIYYIILKIKLIYINVIIKFLKLKKKK